jgi:predicted PurR-regulated permease PerM
MAGKTDFARSAPYWLRRMGVVSWLFLGVILAASLVLTVWTTLAGITTPLLVAVLVGIIFRPMVDVMERRQVPRFLSTLLTMLFIALGAVILITILVQGIVEQGAEIGRQLEVGWASLKEWLLQFPIEPDTLESIPVTGSSIWSVLGQGIIGLLSSTFSSLTAFLIGTYFSLFILFFILRDGNDLEAWLARQFSLRPETSTAIITDASRSVRAYFRGTALTAVITSLVVAIPLVILDVPLVGSILIVYFFTSFIPYLGAWVGGAFAVIIALGAGGAQAALIITVAVIISNGVLQTMVNSWALGSSLQLHPLVVFLVTIIAGMVGGALAMIMAVPLTAFIVQTGARLRDEGVFAEE